MFAAPSRVALTTELREASETADRAAAAIAERAAAGPAQPQGPARHRLRLHRARRDGRAAAEALELGVLDDALLVDLDLELHHVAALGRADDADADILAGGHFLGSAEAADVEIGRAHV